MKRGYRGIQRTKAASSFLTGYKPITYCSNSTINTQIQEHSYVSTRSYAKGGGQKRKTQPKSKAGRVTKKQARVIRIKNKEADVQAGIILPKEPNLSWDSERSNNVRLAKRDGRINRYVLDTPHEYLRLLNQVPSIHHSKFAPENRITHIQLKELLQDPQSNVIVIDIRQDKQERILEPAPDEAIAIPVKELEKVFTLDKKEFLDTNSFEKPEYDRKIVLVAPPEDRITCNNGKDALESIGYNNVHELIGGQRLWNKYQRREAITEVVVLKPQPPIQPPTATDDTQPQSTQSPQI